MSSFVALFGIAAAQVGKWPYWDPLAAIVVSAMIVCFLLPPHVILNGLLIHCCGRCGWVGLW